MLLRHAKWLRSVQLEDVSEATPMHALVAPLRAGLYKALGLARVQEHMCMHNTPPEAWRQGEVVDTAGACELRLPAAELEGEVGGWSFQAVAAYIVGLMEEPPPRGLGGVGSTPLQRKALLLQAALREEAQQLVAAYRTRLRQAPSVSDLHAATAFLSVYSLLNILSDAALPPASQVLHVRVYHLLCQNPPLVAQLHQGGTAGASLHWRSRQSRAVSVGGPSACAPPPPAADDPLSPLAGFMSQLSLAAASAAAAAAGDGLSRPPVPAASRSPPSPQQSASQATASLKQS